MPFIKHVKPTEVWGVKCNSPEHNPPTTIVLPPGIHTWKCPSCGRERLVFIPESTRCNVDSEYNLSEEAWDD